MNKLQIKALLLDAIIHAKTGRHMAGNYKAAKNVFCHLAGISPRCASRTLIKAISYVYADNGIQDEFNGIVNRLKYIIQDGNFTKFRLQTGGSRSL